MYIDETVHPVPGGISIRGLTCQDLLDLYHALATVPISPDDRLFQLRDMIQRFLFDNP